MAAALIVGFLVAATLATVIVHGMLRLFLEARGITPWSMRDSVGASPLIVAGSGGIGAVASCAMQAQQSGNVRGAVLVVLIFTLLVSVLLMRLGFHALRKLT